MYEIFEHTADFGIRARSADLEGLFADAAHALFSLMVANLDGVSPVDEMSFEIDGDQPDELLHDWLAELLYTFCTRRLVFKEFEIKRTPSGISAIARGEPLNTARHEIDVEVKAITWHALKVEQTADGWLAEVIVDV